MPDTRGRGRGAPRGRGTGTVVGGTTGRPAASNSRATRSSAAAGHGSGSATVQPQVPAQRVDGSACALCNASFSQPNDAFGCDKCERWYHPVPSCTGLPPEAIAAIQQFGGNGFAFICNFCRCTTSNQSSPASQQTAAILDSNNMASNINQLFLTVKFLAETVTCLSQQVQELKSRPSPNPVQSLGVNKESLYAELYEFREREKRKDSLIFRSTRVRTASDFSHLFEGVCGEIVDTTPQLSEVICLNENTGMFRVKISNAEARKKILLNAVKLKDSSRYKHVYISRDFTFRQRQEQRAARAERAPQSSRGLVDPNVTGANAEPINSSPRAPGTPPPQDTAARASGTPLPQDTPAESHAAGTSSVPPGAVGSPTPLPPNL